jgi:uncharacterized protein (UPF0276 family)
MTKVGHRSPDPRQAGIGLRAPHYREIAERLPALGFLEVHSENYFADGGPALGWLDKLRATYPVSLHGVGLSIGSCDALDLGHLERLKRLADRIGPALVSEHICWGAIDGRHLNELLPLPYTAESLAHVAARVREVQDYLGRPILVENVSTYLEFAASDIPEWEFVAALARQAGCGLLLDVNNIWVNSVNHGFDPYRYFDAIDGRTVGEIHLAGFEATPDRLIDTHGAAVSADVWKLYEAAIARFGPKPTLIEWDTDIPPLDVLLAEATKADAILARDMAPLRRVASAN